ncbi:hypothetical protein FACS1894160_2450 [Bacteroidia bacterium]|nr:hypothetical protein FACS1894160_2450 [Bacteroidia bacterium]
MMKRILTTTCLIFCFAFLSKSQVIYENAFTTNEDFLKFELYDVDGLRPANTDWGFSRPYKAWIRKVYDTFSFIAVSTSYYDPKGKANDWLVSPGIKIPSEITNARLAWAALAYDSISKDGYKVYITTKGRSISDFTDPPVFSVDEENTFLTYHSVPLDKYAGKTIYIAWLNDSDDKYMLGVTDISVGVTNFSFTPDIPDYTEQAELNIKGIIENKLNNVDEFTAYFTIKDQTYSQKFSNLNIESGTTYSFELDEKIPVEIGETLEYEFWVETKNFDAGKQYGTVARVSEKFPRKIIIEEATGTTYGWCPRGIVRIDSLTKKYPDNVIPIAVHHDGQMRLREYDRAINPLVDAYPSGIINRLTKADPNYFESLCRNLFDKVSPAKVKLSAQFTDKSKKKITANMRFDFAINLAEADFRYLIVVTENKVTGTTNDYEQANYYSGGDYGKMSGFENLPNPVPANKMSYDNVAREIYGSFTGFGGIIPPKISVGTPINTSYTFDLPSSVGDINNCDFIVILIDGRTSEIINADRIAASGIITSINKIESTGLIVDVHKDSPETIAVSIATETNDAVSVTVFDSTGKAINEPAPFIANRRKQVVISTGKRSGIHLVKVKSGDLVVTKKIIL